MLLKIGQEQVRQKVKIIIEFVILGQEIQQKSNIKLFKKGRNNFETHKEESNLNSFHIFYSLKIFNNTWVMP